MKRNRLVDQDLSFQLWLYESQRQRRRRLPLDRQRVHAGDFLVAAVSGALILVAVNRDPSPFGDNFRNVGFRDLFAQ